MCAFGNEEQAIKIAEQKRRQCIETGKEVPSRMIPCTTMDKLIKDIKRKY